MKKLIFVALGFFVMSAFTVPVNKEDFKELQTTLEQVKQAQDAKSYNNPNHDLSPFCYASAVGDTSDEYYNKLKNMIKKGANINLKNCGEKGRTPLMYGIIHRDNKSMRVIKLLVSNGADVNMQSDLGETPLIAAASLGYLDVVKYLVGEGNNFDKAEVNAQSNNQYGVTALMQAAQEGHLDVVKYLVGEGNNFEKAEVNKQDKNGETALTVAAQNGHLDIVKYLVENPFDKAKVKEDEALFYAARKGHLDIVKYLVGEGNNFDKADVNMQVQDQQCKTALMWAVFEGHLDIVKYLVGEGNNFEKADVNIKNDKDWTALTYAARFGNLDIVKYLVEEGKAEVNILGKDGFSPLALAAMWGHFDIVKYLVENDVNKADISLAEDDIDVIANARLNGHPEIAQYLEEQMKK